MHPYEKKWQCSYCLERYQIASAMPMYLYRERVLCGHCAWRMTSRQWPGAIAKIERQVDLRREQQTPKLSPQERLIYAYR